MPPPQAYSDSRFSSLWMGKMKCFSQFELRTVSILSQCSALNSFGLFSNASWTHRFSTDQPGLFGFCVYWAKETFDKQLRKENNRSNRNSK